MKITRREGMLMELEGVPQSRGLLFSALVAAALAIVFGMFTFYMFMKSGWTSAIMPGLGTLFGLILFCFVFAMSLRRERLTLDRVSRIATHATWSILLGGNKAVQYPFEKIAAVSIERSMQSSGGKRGFATRVTRARLLITKPKRAVQLDETQGGGKKTVEEVEALALEVGTFLGVEVRVMGRHAD